MNSQPVVYDPSAALSASSARRAAANDGTAEANVNTVRNPLWMMAIGMAVFFAAAVAVAALG